VSGADMMRLRFGTLKACGSKSGAERGVRRMVTLRGFG
jgi:hypothetical protein